MKEYILNGNNFSTMDEFYNEIQKIMTCNLNWKIGHNLDALNDILRGGFGQHYLNESVTIKWINYGRSKDILGVDNVLDIIEVILDARDSGHDCKLELY